MSDRLKQIHDTFSRSGLLSFDDTKHILAELTRAQAVIEAAREVSDNNCTHEFSSAFVSDEGHALRVALEKYDDGAP